MTDMDDSTFLTKQQKKRQRKAAKSLIAKLNGEKEENNSNNELDPLTVMKEQLADAKKNGDSDLVKRLRQDIWVLQDTCAGHQPALSTHEVASSLDRITANVEINKEEVPAIKSTLSSSERRLKSLNKKLQQIEELKIRKIKGEKLELTQVAKIDTEAALRSEIEELSN